MLRLLVIAVGLLCGAMAVTVAAAYRRQPGGVVPAGVHVAGIDLGDKPVAEARTVVKAWRDARRADKLSLAAPSGTPGAREWTARRADLGVDVDVDATVAAAEQCSRDMGPVERIGQWISGPRSVDLKPVWKVDQAALRRFLVRRVARRLSHPPRDARFLALPEGFRIVAGHPGSGLDTNQAVKLVADQAAQPSPPRIMLPVVSLAPHVGADDLRGIEGEVARFRTSYAETGNRHRNIEVACSHINGTVLKPGDRFSYNQVVGPRDSDSGFRMAPVIVRGKLEPGLGGGVCQVSSTLYNAALLADLKIVRRSHHAFPVHYLPAGRDATVAYDAVDFQFVNNTGAPIAVASSSSGGHVTMRIFGKRVAGRQVRIERTNVSSWGPGTETVRDSSLPAGARRTVDSGHAGHRVTVWRVVVVNGRQVRREVISRDHYQAFPRVVALGPSAPPRRPAVAPSRPATTAPASTEPGTLEPPDPAAHP